MTQTVTEFELVDHGIENEQYFQGCGVSFTRFDNVATGIGDNPAKAIDDCLEQIATGGTDTEGMEKRILADIGKRRMPRRPQVSRKAEDCHYYVSIRWNEEPLFSVVEYSSFFAVRHNPTGEEHPMGDGVDTLSDAEGNTLFPGTDGFVETWEKALNSNESETLEAYFPELYAKSE